MVSGARSAQHGRVSDQPNQRVGGAAAPIVDRVLLANQTAFALFYDNGAAARSMASTLGHGSPAGQTVITMSTAASHASNRSRTCVGVP